MTETPHLGLPLIAAAQAQKHVTHNEALVALDALVQCAVLDKDLALPPTSPAEGDRYIVAATPSDDWAGQADQIAVRQDGLWTYYAPQTGFIVFVVDESLLYFFSASGWIPLASALGAVQNLSLLGIGTNADESNPVSAKLNAALWTAKGVSEGGSGDLRYTLNKESAANVLSLLFQSGYSGRLELGLVGDDDVHFKVSADGSTWAEPLRVDRSTGGVDLLAAEASLASATTCDLGSVRTLKVNVTGTTSITGFGTRPHLLRLLRFSGALTLTHNPTSLVLPGAASIVTAPGDTCLAVSDASGNWRVRNYTRASGKALVAPSAAEVGLGAGSTPTFAGLTTTGLVSGQIANAGIPDVLQLSNTGITGANQGASLSFLMRSTGALAYGGRIAAVASADYATPANWSSYLQFQAMVGGTLTVCSRLNPVTNQHMTFLPFLPSTDNGLTLGLPAYRWSVVYAGTGAISTSDARDKTEVMPMSAAEIAAAGDLAREIGTFQMLDAVAQKGLDAARRHCGLTVQRAAEMLRRHGLEPMRYAFICHDSWEATPETPAVDPVAAIRDDRGAIVSPEEPGRAAEPGRPAGDRYGFRPDQLALFIARGQEARLAALEAKLA